MTTRLGPLASAAAAAAGAAALDSTYTVSTDGHGTYTLTNAQTGALFGQGSDCASLVNSAISTLSSGGVLTFAPAQFTLTHPIVCDKNDVVLRGSGAGSRASQLLLSATPGQLFAPDPNTLLVTGGVSQLFSNSAAAIIMGNTGLVTRCAVLNLSVEGNCFQNLGNLSGLPYDGIWIRGNDCLVSGCHVQHCPHNGFRLDSPTFNTGTIFDALFFDNYSIQNVNNQFFIGIKASDWEFIQCRADGGRSIGLLAGTWGQASSNAFYCQGGAGKLISCHAYFAPALAFYADRGNQVDIISGSWENNAAGGIFMQNFSGGTMRRMRIIDAWCYDNGVHDVLLQGVDYGELRGVRCTSGTGNIRLTQSCTHCAVSNCSGQYDPVGFSADNTCSDIDFSDNILLPDDNPGGTANGGISFQAQSGRLLGNTCAAALTIGPSATAVLVQGNRAATLSDSGTATQLSDNSIGGKPTRASGTATVSASTTATVSHGLARTPTSVQLTPQADPGGRYWASAIGSSTFQINLQTSGTVPFSWSAQ